MDSPFAFQESSIVFQAPVQRRQTAPQSLGVRSTVTSTPRADPFPARRAYTSADWSPPPPAERSYSPLPTMPTLLRTRSHLRSLPNHGLSPVRTPTPAQAYSTSPYRPLALFSSESRPSGSSFTGESRLSGSSCTGGSLAASRIQYSEHVRAYVRDEIRIKAEKEEEEKKEQLFGTSCQNSLGYYRRMRDDSACTPRYVPRYEPRDARDPVERRHFVSDMNAGYAPPYASSSPVAHIPAETRRRQIPASVRPVDTSAAATGPVEPPKKKRKARICTAEGCTKYVVDHGLCIRHGGGKRCYIEGCNCRAQNRGLCWKHGGFTICTVDGCTKRAKSRGICWSHGGGTRCKCDDCSKIAVSNGLCWAHGGGKRCVFGRCRKPASERTDNFCNEHYAQEHPSDPDAERVGVRSPGIMMTSGPRLGTSRVNAAVGRAERYSTLSFVAGNLSAPLDNRGQLL